MPDLFDPLQIRSVKFLNRIDLEYLIVGGGGAGGFGGGGGGGGEAWVTRDYR